jgi:hypothetical protein
VIRKIISGGQTGADRGGLEAGLELGIEIGGWCPKHRLAEDGKVPEKYPLQETSAEGYPMRTARNVEDSDATVIFIYGQLGQESGSRLTLDYVHTMRRKFALVKLKSDPEDTDDDRAKELAEWLNRVRPGILNVAGNRESVSPGIQAQVSAIMVKAIRLYHEGTKQ